MWVRVNAQPVIDADGSVAGAAISLSDITALRQAAAELHHSEQFLQVLLENLEEGIVACERRGGSPCSIPRRAVSTG